MFSDGAVSLHTRSLKYGKVSCSKALGLGLVLFNLALKSLPNGITGWNWQQFRAFYLMASACYKKRGMRRVEKKRSPFGESSGEGYHLAYQRVIARLVVLC